MVGLLSRADQAVGRLDGLTRTLPNPDLFLAMYVRREAVLSSQIEGTQSTLEDVLSYELDPRNRGVPQDVEEVVNYVSAMNYGLERLTTLPLSLRLIREIHAELLSGVRGPVRERCVCVRLALKGRVAKRSYGDGDPLRNGRKR